MFKWLLPKPLSDKSITPYILNLVIKAKKQHGRINLVLLVKCYNHLDWIILK